MILSDHDIKQAIADGRIVIDPPVKEEDIQPASLDVHLGQELFVFNNYEQAYIDVREPTVSAGTIIQLNDDDDPFVLHPGEFVLAAIREHLCLSSTLVARLEGKSSLGRLGLAVHSTAGFVDPGWMGRLTLELSNLARLPITLYRGMEIAQLSFLQMTSPADRPYGSPGLGSKYQGDVSPTASRYASRPTNRN